MNVDPRFEMEQAKNLIKAKRYDEARAILQRLNNPTAQRWIEKLDEIEMFGAPIEAGTARISTPPNMQAYPSRNAQQLLQAAISVFLHHDWTVSSQFNDMVHVEKKRAPSSLGAAALIVLFGLIGMCIVLLAIANSKTEKVSLQGLPDGRVQVINRKRMTLITNPSQVESLAKSVKKGANYGATLALGIGSTLFWFFVLSR